MRVGKGLKEYFDVVAKFQEEMRLVARHQVGDDRSFNVGVRDTGAEI